MAPPKWVFSFGAGTAEGRGEMKDLLGGKGADLAQMALMGLPVPPGFTLTTEVSALLGAGLPEGLRSQVLEALALMEARTQQRFGDAENPLLLSVRPGARASMPGMMDVVLNVGLNDETAEGLARRSGDRRFAFDTYRRFVQSYATVVLGVDAAVFERLLQRAKRRRGVSFDHELRAQDSEALVAAYKARVAEEMAFPELPEEQLWGALRAVFGSWRARRAQTFRRLHGMSEAWGTAANVQAMVFGNMGQDCAAGVAFTRNPSNGMNEFYGEFLINAQGEEVVAGMRTPQDLTRKAREAHGSKLPSLQEAMPKMFNELLEVRRNLEVHYRDIQDIEFTIQRGTLFMLQTRTAKRTALAALKIAVEMAKDGLTSKREAILRLRPESLDQLLHPTLDPIAEKRVVARGLPASPGAASGKVVFTSDDALRLSREGEAVLLVREETSPEDIHGIHAARGILTVRGGMTSHAAVVARGMGRPCVSAVGAMRVDCPASALRIGDLEVRAGEMLTIDGGAGEVMLGEVPTVPARLSGDFATIMSWADEFRRMRVRANAETLTDARVAREFGADGLGLIRTEHMFFDGDRIVAMREMILALNEAGRRAACDKLLKMQRDDLVDIFLAMDGLPVTVRFLDPPLHEFLPHTEQEMASVAAAAKVPLERVRRRAAELHEANPMLGHRGCRLAITFPEIYEMQARAIFEAALEAGRRSISGRTPVAELVVPLVATVQEIDILKALVQRVALRVQEEQAQSLAFRLGTMIELPRAALMAGDLAKTVDFFSFGTNDLTQTTWGLSRDDSGGFLPQYMARDLVGLDPFMSLDQDGVGELMRIAVDRGRATRPGIKLGICGEHGGDPSSIHFCERIGLDYISCSPFRVPIARLAAAQAAALASEARKAAPTNLCQALPPAGGA